MGPLSDAYWASFWRYLVVTGCLTWASVVVFFGVVIWLFVLYRRRAYISRAVINAHLVNTLIGLPGLVALAKYYELPFTIPVPEYTAVRSWIAAATYAVVRAALILERSVVLHFRKQFHPTKILHVPALPITIIALLVIYIYVERPPSLPWYLIGAFFVALVLLAFFEKTGSYFPPPPGQRPPSKEVPAAQESLSSPTFPVPAIPTAKPRDAFYLKIKRTQRTSVWGTALFAIDARMELSPEEISLVSKYKLASAIVYDSVRRRQFLESAQAHLELTRPQTGFFASTTAQLLDAGRSVYRLARASISLGAAALSLRVTIGSLIQGVHIECKSLTELLEAEEAIMTAAQNTKAYLATAATFDGREDLIEIR